MKRHTLSTPLQDRLVAGLGSVVVMTLFGYLLLLGLTVEMPVSSERPMALLNLQAPPRPSHRKSAAERPKARHKSGPSSPRNLKNKATEIVAPLPLVPPPVPSPVVTAAHAGPGMASSTGASDRPGPGEGAGGEGNGTGSGGSGAGEGGDDVPPRWVKGRLKFSDLPEDLREGEGRTVGVRYHVEIDGRVSGCVVTVSSGSSQLDDLTCRLIEQRFRFQPSRRQDGSPVRSTVVENHSWIIDRSEYQPSAGH